MVLRTVPMIQPQRNAIDSAERIILLVLYCALPLSIDDQQLKLAKRPVTSRCTAKDRRAAYWRRLPRGPLAHGYPWLSAVRCPIAPRLRIPLSHAVVSAPLLPPPSSHCGRSAKALPARCA